MILIAHLSVEQASPARRAALMESMPSAVLHYSSKSLRILTGLGVNRDRIIVINCDFCYSVIVNPDRTFSGSLTASLSAS